jgi:predicted nucleic acid-binding protein
LITFVDSGVLIAAVRGTEEVATRAMAVLDDPRRSFVSSPFIRLEVLPKALFHRQAAEVAFYQTYFASVDRWAAPTAELVDEAFAEAARSNLSAQDALHVAAAVATGAEELVTTEKTSKPLHSVTSVRVRTLHP